MSTYDIKGNRIPEWFELPPVTEARPMSTTAINHLLQELTCNLDKEASDESSVPADKINTHTKNSKDGK